MSQQSQSRVSPLWYLLGVIVVGFVAWMVIKFVLSILFFLIVGAVVVGAIVLLSGKSRRSVGGGGRRSIR
jgi:energy-coupling factor transporter transmembrane protein EcfT